jgi:hypothetical protein
VLDKFFHGLKPSPVIRNPVYTGETRLRGLEIHPLLVEMVGAIRKIPPARWRERIYTGETRLRGLGIYPLLVHEGGLCLCSREFHSPGIICLCSREFHSPGIICLCSREFHSPGLISSFSVL